METEKEGRKAGGNEGRKFFSYANKHYNEIKTGNCIG